MNIGLDSYSLWKSKGRGIGNYTVELYKKLIEKNKKMMNRIYVLNWQKESLREYFGDGADYIEYNADVRLGQNFDKEYVNAQIHNFIETKDLDVFYTSNALDLTMPFYTKSTGVFGKAKLVGTVHDIIPWKMRKLYFASGGEEKYRTYCENLKEYDLIFSNSNTTKEDLSIEFGINNVANISMSSEIPQVGLSQLENRFSEIRKKLGILGKYNIFVGGLGINKNMHNVLRAYLKFCQENKDANALVIVCALKDQARMDIYYFIKRYKLENKLIFTDYIGTIELAALYAHADWCIFPTLYEGFGMPIIEGWKYGLPVLTSDNSSLAEITGDAAVHVNPYCIESIQKGFERIYSMGDKEKEYYKKKGQERVKQFSWDKTADLFWQKVQDIIV